VRWYTVSRPQRALIVAHGSMGHNVDTKSSSLAYCELYVTLGTLFRRFDKLKVYNTGPEDLVYDDYFSSYHPVDARKFHVISEISFEG
jgi:hypothetical protein